MARKSTKIPSPPPRPLIPSLFLIVLHQIKALHNFCKRGQCSDHTEYTLTSDYNNFPNDLCDSKNALGLKPWPSQWGCNVLITRIFPTGEWRSSLTRQKFAPLPPLYPRKNFLIYQIFIPPLPSPKVHPPIILARKIVNYALFLHIKNLLFSQIPRYL